MKNPFIDKAKEMTIEEWFTLEKIDLDFLDRMSEDSPYWTSAEVFISANWTSPVASLSEKQAAWASKILDDCVEKRIERRAR